MADYKKSTTGQLIGQAIKELGLSVADHAMRGNDRGALSNAGDSITRRKNDVEVGEYLNSKSYAAGQADEDSDPTDEAGEYKKVNRKVWK